MKRPVGRVRLPGLLSERCAHAPSGYSFWTAKLQAEMAIAFRNRKTVFVGEHAWVLPVSAASQRAEREKANCVSSVQT
jgi:hypothetical protein